MERPETGEEDQDQTKSQGDESETSEGNLETISDDDETSSSGSSSEDDEDSDDQKGADDDAALATSSSPALSNSTSSSTALKSRLASFLPKLQQANAELETDPEAATKRIDDVADDEEQYIEMNLGLGVLKAKPTADKASAVKTRLQEDSDSYDEEDTVSSEDDAGAETTEVGVVDKLRGVRPTKRKIEEVG